ncbi:hypothetical protein BDQ17DRAFT_1253376 [Cyathus striatus]|nr:hypothetical protein BDQ17DRAFT_1253376 [Cyathus striatus]
MWGEREGGQLQLGHCTRSCKDSSQGLIPVSYYILSLSPEISWENNQIVVVKIFLENDIRDSVTYTEHAKCKPVTAFDVVYALKRSGHTVVLYGFSA